MKLTMSNNCDTGSSPSQYGELVDLSHFQDVVRCQFNCDSLLIVFFHITESFKISSLWGNIADYAWQGVKCQLMHHVREWIMIW